MRILTLLAAFAIACGGESAPADGGAEGACEEGAESCGISFFTAPAGTACARFETAVDASVWLESDPSCDAAHLGGRRELAPGGCLEVAADPAYDEHWFTTFHASAGVCVSFFAAAERPDGCGC